jgi:hypothetical protein
VGQLLAAVLARGGKSLPFAPELLRSDATPRSLLRNWSLLEPCLAAYGVELRPDDKALIVAGGAHAGARARAAASWFA